MENQVKDILSQINKAKIEKDGTLGYTKEQIDLSNLSDDDLEKKLKEAKTDDEQFDIIMGQLRRVQTSGDENIQKAEVDYKQKMEAIRRGKGSIIDVYKQYEQEAIARKDFASANKYKNIYTQIEMAYSLSNFKDLIKNKPNTCVIPPEMMDECSDVFKKNKEKLGRRLSNIHKFKFDTVDEILNNLANALIILGRNDNEILIMQCFILKHFNFTSVNNNKYFVSKLFFNIKALTNSQILDKQMEGFKNSLLEVLESIVKINS